MSGHRTGCFPTFDLRQHARRRAKTNGQKSGERSRYLDGLARVLPRYGPAGQKCLGDTTNKETPDPAMSRPGQPHSMQQPGAALPRIM